MVKSEREILEYKRVKLSSKWFKSIVIAIEARKSMAPGPAQYPIHRKSGISPLGNYYMSKYVGSGAPKFGKDHRHYFLSISKYE